MQGLPQSIQLTFLNLVRPTSISITFQGGFVGTRCVVSGASSGNNSAEWKILGQLYPEDVNRRQTFLLPGGESKVDQLKLTFEESSDFFGRITIYELDVLGEA